jgi:hypothetical protein
MTLAICLLGKPMIQRHGVSAPPPRGRKTWALLTFLLLSERPPLAFPYVSGPVPGCRGPAGRAAVDARRPASCALPARRGTTPSRRWSRSRKALSWGRCTRQRRSGPSAISPMAMVFACTWTARLANTAASLGPPLRALTTDVGVDLTRLNCCPTRHPLPGGLHERGRRVHYRLAGADATLAG